MKTFTLDLPSMYGDHHVIEVRRILFEMPGISDVYASSAFHVVEVTYDPAQVSEDAIKSRLEAAGYLGELEVPMESGVPVNQRAGFQQNFRHTVAYEAAGKMVSFGQTVPYLGRPLWPCPGMGPVSRVDEGNS